MSAWSVGVALLLAAGCEGPEPLKGTWGIRFVDSELETRAHLVEATILEGDCGSEDVVYRARFAPDGSGSTAPRLAPGRYSFAAQARDADCQWFARGCVTVVLPLAQDADVEILVEATPPLAACDTGACSEGGCVGEDTGTVPDGGIADDAGEVGLDGGDLVDAGPLDAGPPDAGPPDAGPLDAGPPDTGPACDGTERPEGGCYAYFSDPQRTWDEAQAQCETWGGHLLIVDDADEEAWVLDTFGPEIRFWIGLTDDPDEMTWRWVDGTEPGYLHWGDGEPNNGNGNVEEDCAEYRNDRGNWDDRRCTETRDFVCER